MLSTFDLAPGATREAFATAWAALATDLVTADLVVAMSPLAERRAETPLDTDAARPHRFCTVMSFRDRAQSDAAYACIEERAQPTTRLHARVMAIVRDPVFTCWEDVAPAPAGASPGQGA